MENAWVATSMIIARISRVGHVQEPLSGFHLGSSSRGAISTTAELRGAWVRPNIFRVPITHIVVTTLPFIIIETV